MIVLGQHADNCRGVGQPFEASLAQCTMFNLEHIEVGTYYGMYFVAALGYEPSLNLLDDPLEYRKKADKIGVRFSQVDAASPMFEMNGSMQGLMYATQAMRYASDLGAKSIVVTDRGAPADFYTEQYAWDYGVRNHAELLKWAENYKIKVNIETHGVYTQDAEFMLKFLGHFESEWLGMNFDTGNTFIAGNDPLEYLKQVIKYVNHFHIKDVDPVLADESRGEETGIGMSYIPIGSGANGENIAKCLRYLKEINWSGDISLECAGTDENVGASAKWIRSILDN
ncbi:MAG: sugar phosphate isomerase/epimerase [Clostridiales bacterium]|nr:sugar phosphate isomerase/epimerase [Clostridiales bacterium]